MHIIDTTNERRFIKENNRLCTKFEKGEYNKEAPYGGTTCKSIYHGNASLVVQKMKDDITAKELGFKVRGNGAKSLPDVIDYKGWHLSRNWKERKVRKQWMSNRSVALLKKRTRFESKKKNIKECNADKIAFDTHIKDVNLKFFETQFGGNADKLMEQYRKFLSL